MVIVGSKGFPARCVGVILMLASTGFAAGCGGRSLLDGAEPRSEARPRDPTTLALERCEGYRAPSFEPRLVTSAWLTSMAPCGHLITEKGTTFRVYQPDLALVVARGELGAPLVSPEGTEIAYRDINSAGGSVISRINLVEGVIQDTPVMTHETIEGRPRGDFGFFLDEEENVQFWICDGEWLRTYRGPGSGLVQAAELPSSPSCNYVYERDGRFLLELRHFAIGAVDLIAGREHEVQLDTYADEIYSILGGEAVSSVYFSEVIDGDVVRRTAHVQALFETRTGRRLAQKWEYVPTGQRLIAANRLGEPPALLTPGPSGVVVTEGLRGIYVFRDFKRAFAVAETEDGGNEVVLADLVTGERFPISAGVPFGWLPDGEVADGGRNPYSVSVLSSPLEHAVYLKLGPCGELSTDCPGSFEWVRWVDGAVEPVEGSRGAESAAFVADNGSALLLGGPSSFVVDPTGAIVPFPFSLTVGPVQSDGSIVIFEERLETPPEPGVTSHLVAFEPATGELRELGVSHGNLITTATDVFHRALAFDVTGSAEAAPGEDSREVWLGRFPAGR